MRAGRQVKAKPPSGTPPAFAPVRSGFLQRKCACGGTPGPSGECAECAKKKKLLQLRLTIGRSNDPMEQEAERIADRLWASPADFSTSGPPLRIQRCCSETQDAQMAPGSVDQVLATPGRPLEPELRRDMELRFGHDFSRVRIHSSAAAEESAREVNADAYTVGSDIVFGAGQLRSATREGRRLLAHELTHVVQQGGASVLESANHSPAATTDRAGISNSQPVSTILQRQPALAPPTNDAPKADAPAAPTGAAAKAAVPAAAPAQQLPICQATAVSNWIRDPKNPKEEQFGLTELSTAGTRPEFRVGPASSGKGFVVLPTSASLANPISMQYLKPGRYPEHAIRLRLQEGGPAGGYLRVWEVTDDGSEAIKAGEQEHCDDFRLAYYFSFYRYAELVNEVATKGTVFPTEAAAKASLNGKVFIEASKLPDYFTCVATHTRDQRDKAGWHTPRKSEPTLGYDAKLRDNVAVRTLSASSLPQVGKHSSGEVCYNAALACIGHTTLPPVTP